jgi:hypothetical protein
MPTKSRPGMRSRNVPSIFPSMFSTSLGFTGAGPDIDLRLDDGSRANLNIFARDYPGFVNEGD